MVWINDSHHNSKTTPGSFGGAQCTCKDCTEKYWQEDPNEFETGEVLCGHCGKTVKVFIKDFIKKYAHFLK